MTSPGVVLPGSCGDLGGSQAERPGNRWHHCSEDQALTSRPGKGPGPGIAITTAGTSLDNPTILRRAGCRPLPPGLPTRLERARHVAEIDRAADAGRAGIRNAHRP